MMATPMIKVNAADTRFARFVRGEKGRFARGAGAMKKANQRSVDWLAERAAQNLMDRRRRNPDYRHGRLADLIRNPGVHKVGADGFQFMIHARVDALNARIAAYYRVIEGHPGDDVGTWYWVERTHQRGPLKMWWQGSNAKSSRGFAEAGQFARDGTPTIFINPIPAYHYLYNARESFIRANMYSRFTHDELRSAGVLTKGQRVR